MTTENNTIEQFGVHFMLDGYGASEDTLKDKLLLTNMLRNVPTAMGMHIINKPVVVEVGPKNRKDPGGISGFVMIAESHISFHTFPARGFVTIDVYTCQNNLDTDKLKDEFTKAFMLESTDIHIQKRGVRYPSENIY
jgi:S-adenosylmethionine decarboxylase